MPAPREVLLFLHALRLARRAQAVGRTPLPALVAQLPRLRCLPREVDPDDALRATLRATTRGQRSFGWLGTCLVKSLVLSALLSDRDGVELVVGFRPLESDSKLDGHAWVRLGGREFSFLGSLESADAGYVRLHALPVRRTAR